MNVPVKVLLWALPIMMCVGIAWAWVKEAPQKHETLKDRVVVVEKDMGVVKTDIGHIKEGIADIKTMMRSRHYKRGGK